MTPVAYVGGDGEGIEPTAFLGGKLELVQPKRGYRAGFDAILLAACAPVPAGAGMAALDAGAGVGAVGLSLAARVGDVRVTLVERVGELVDMAAWNIRHNGLGDRCRVLEADVTASGSALREVGLEPESQDYVIANPPYFINGTNRASCDPLRAAAHQMAHSELEAWLKFAARMIKPHGCLMMIHRTEALPALLDGLAGRFGDVAVVPIHSRRGEAAGRVVVKARKGSRAPLRLLPGLVVHEGPDNAFRDEVKAVCRDGAGLDLF